MKRILLAALPALLLATMAGAQEVPEQATMDLWCGIAFGIVSAGAPGDATEDQKAIIKEYADGGARLVEQAKAAHLENGYTETSFAAHLDTVTAEVNTQVNATDDSAAYSFEDCSALIGM